MAVSHFFDEQYPLVYTVFSGLVTDDDFAEHSRVLLADPRFEASMPELVDLREVTRVELSAETIPLSARSLLHAPQAKRAVVAPTDFLYGLARMYQAYRDKLAEGDFRVFRSMPAALEWFGLTEEPRRT